MRRRLFRRNYDFNLLTRLRDVSLDGPARPDEGRPRVPRSIARLVLAIRAAANTAASWLPFALPYTHRHDIIPLP